MSSLTVVQGCYTPSAEHPPTEIILSCHYIEIKPKNNADLRALLTLI